MTVKIKTMLLMLVVSLIILVPDSVKATDAHECTYINDNGNMTLKYYNSNTDAYKMRGKITLTRFKDDKFTSGKEIFDENLRSLAMHQATGICPQTVVVVKNKSKYIAYAGNNSEVDSWRKSNYLDNEYEISRLAGDDNGGMQGIIDRMNQVNEKDYLWFQYGNFPKPCTYNNSQITVNIMPNYFEAIKSLGRGGDSTVCPDHIYQYCDAKNPNSCAFSFFPEEQYLCKYNMFVCKKIDVNGITEVPKTEPPVKVEPKKKNVMLYIEKEQSGRPNEVELVVDRNESNEIKTTLTMTGNIKAALVGTDVSKTQLANFVGDNGGAIYSLHCLTYDDFTNKRNEKYSYSTNFSGGDLKNYSYVCALKAEEQLAWTTSISDSYTMYVIRTIDNMELISGYDRLISLNKFASCANLQDDELTNCLNAQKTLYDEALKLRNQCKKAYANLDYKCEKADNINFCKDNCCACEFIDTIIVEYAKDGYFGNRIISGSNGTDCKGILGSLGDWLSRIYNILKLAVPAIIVAMGFKDFIQGMSSGKDDALKKAGTNFIKRLVVGAVFVMLPILIKMILTFAFGGSFSDICISL